MKKILLFFFVIMFPHLLHSQWFNYNTDSTLATTYFNSVHFVDTLNGWIACDNGLIIHTTNGGINWIRQTSGFLGHLRKIRFSDSLHGWVIGDSGKILYTFNGGNSWLSQNSGGSWTLNMLSVVNSTKAWISGNERAIFLNTTDSGSNWDTLNPQIPGGDKISDIFFVDSSKGWYCTWHYISPPGFTGGSINNTWTGGLYWWTQSWSQNILRSIHFIDSDYGWCTGDWVIYKTTNGTTWNKLDFPQHWFSHIYFVTPYIGWVIDWGFGPSGPSHSYIHFSSDGGYNWSYQFASQNRIIKDICFVEQKHGWAVGQSGLILHTTNGGGALTSANNDEPSLLPSFSFSQNYPNPFNPSTKIKYAISSQQYATLKVSDILGNEIETLVNDEKSPGTYVVTWNATNLPSGVYFYQLRTGNFLETKKMILLR